MSFNRIKVKEFVLSLRYSKATESTKLIIQEIKLLQPILLSEHHHLKSQLSRLTFHIQPFIWKTVKILSNQIVKAVRLLGKRTTKLSVHKMANETVDTNELFEPRWVKKYQSITIFLSLSISFLHFLPFLWFKNRNK